jgi:hypothetical protein
MDDADADYYVFDFFIRVMGCACPRPRELGRGWIGCDSCRLQHFWRCIQPYRGKPNVCEGCRYDLGHSPALEAA